VARRSVGDVRKRRYPKGFGFGGIDECFAVDDEMVGLSVLLQGRADAGSPAGTTTTTPTDTTVDNARAAAAERARREAVARIQRRDARKECPENPVWRLGASARGFALEDAFGGNLAGTATSIKSVDTAAPYYKLTPSNINKKIRDWSRTLSKFPVGSKYSNGGPKNLTLYTADIKRWVMQVIFPLCRRGGLPQTTVGIQIARGATYGPTLTPKGATFDRIRMTCISCDVYLYPEGYTVMPLKTYEIGVMGGWPVVRLPEYATPVQLGRAVQFAIGESSDPAPPRGGSHRYPSDDDNRDDERRVKAAGSEPPTLPWGSSVSTSRNTTSA
jgi:hypothetical protein